VHLVKPEPSSQANLTGGTDLTGRTVSGLRWSYLASGVNAVLQVAVTAFLARLLYPDAFGVVAMAGVLLRFGQYFAQMGVGRALVQRPDISNRDIRAAFTSSVLLGAALSALFWVAAPLSVFLFHDPQVVPILRVSGLSFVLAGLSTTALALLQRELRFRSIAVIEMASYALVYGPLGVALAYAGLGPWSLVAAALGQTALTAVLAYSFSRHTVRPSLDTASLRALYSFGSRVSGISVLEFLALNLNPLWIGNRLGATALGIYNRGFSLINVPAYYFTASLTRVMFSSMSRVQTDTAKLRRTYIAVTAVFAALLIPACWGAAAASQQVVLVLLGPRWTEAIPIFAILAAVAPFTFLAGLSGLMCEVTAALNPKVILSVARLAALVILLLALSPFGLVGCTLAYAIEELLQYAAYFLLMRSVLATPVRGLWACQAAGYAFGSVVVALTLVVGWLAGAAHLPMWLTLTIQVAAGSCMLMILVLRGFSGAVWTAVGSGLRWAERIELASRSGRVMLWLDSHAARPRSPRT